jgi:hypothetical protein
LLFSFIDQKIHCQLSAFPAFPRSGFLTGPEGFPHEPAEAEDLPGVLKSPDQESAPEHPAGP